MAFSVIPSVITLPTCEVHCIMDLKIWKFQVVHLINHLLFIIYSQEIADAAPENP